MLFSPRRFDLDVARLVANTESLEGGQRLSNHNALGGQLFVQQRLTHAVPVLNTNRRKIEGGHILRRLNFSAACPSKMAVVAQSLTLRNGGLDPRLGLIILVIVPDIQGSEFGAQGCIPPIAFVAYFPDQKTQHVEHSTLLRSFVARSPPAISPPLVPLSK